ncbi:MAG: hypothetical protein ACKO04_16440, partial [Actinomycetes bacterium]
MHRGVRAALTAALLLSGAACATTGDSSTSDSTPSGVSSEVVPPTSSPVSTSPAAAPPTSPRPTGQSQGAAVEANATVDRIVDGDTLVAVIG